MSGFFFSYCTDWAWLAVIQHLTSNLGRLDCDSLCCFWSEEIKHLLFENLVLLSFSKMKKYFSLKHTNLCNSLSQILKVVSIDKLTSKTSLFWPLTYIELSVNSACFWVFFFLTSLILIAVSNGKNMPLLNVCITVGYSMFMTLVSIQMVYTITVNIILTGHV